MLSTMEDKLAKLHHKADIVAKKWAPKLGYDDAYQEAYLAGWKYIDKEIINWHIMEKLMQNRIVKLYLSSTEVRGCKHTYTYMPDYDGPHNEHRDRAVRTEQDHEPMAARSALKQLYRRAKPAEKELMDEMLKHNTTNLAELTALEGKRSRQMRWRTLKDLRAKGSSMASHGLLEAL